MTKGAQTKVLSQGQEKRSDNPMLVVSESMGEKKGRGITRVECIAQSELVLKAWCLSTSVCAKDGRLKPLEVLQPIR